MKITDLHGLRTSIEFMRQLASAAREDRPDSPDFACIYTRGDDNGLNVSHLDNVLDLAEAQLVALQHLKALKEFTP